MLNSIREFRIAIKNGNKEMATKVYREAVFNTDNAKDISIIDKQWNQFLRTETLADSMAKDYYIEKLRNMWHVTHRLLLGDRPEIREMLKVFTANTFYHEIETQKDTRSLDDFRSCYMDVNSILANVKIDFRLYGIVYDESKDVFNVGITNYLTYDGIEALSNTIDRNDEAKAVFIDIFGDIDPHSLKEVVQDPAYFEDMQANYYEFLDRAFGDITDQVSKYGPDVLVHLDEIEF